MGSLKKIQPFGPTVWHAIGNIYECLVLLLRYILIINKGSCYITKVLNNIWTTIQINIKTNKSNTLMIRIIFDKDKAINELQKLNKIARYFSTKFIKWFKFYPLKSKKANSSLKTSQTKVNCTEQWNYGCF